jgi:hypothetical protein
MKQSILTKHLNRSKIGDIVIVPMGMIFPHAVKLTHVYKGEFNQIVGEGYSIELVGCSTYHLGESMSICLGFYK